MPVNFDVPLQEQAAAYAEGSMMESSKRISTTNVCGLGGLDHEGDVLRLQLTIVLLQKNKFEFEHRCHW